MVAILQRAEFIEHRPGSFQVQIAGRQPAAEALPTAMGALGTLAQGVLRPPGPMPATARWSDNRGLVVAVAAMVFLGVLAVAVAVYLAVTRGSTKRFIDEARHALTSQS